MFRMFFFLRLGGGSGVVILRPMVAVGPQGPHVAMPLERGPGAMKKHEKAVMSAKIQFDVCIPG